LKKRPNLFHDAEVLIDSFLSSWEANWTEASKYSSLEKAVIRSFLTKKVISNYVLTGHIAFTKAELASAVDYLLNLDKQKLKKSRESSGPISQCLDFVNLWLAQWDKADSYTRDEIAKIRTKLYSRVADNYVRTNKTQLTFTKKDLSDSVAFIDSVRHKRCVEAHADDRDQNIRKARTQYGSIALPCTVIKQQY